MRKRANAAVFFAVGMIGLMLVFRNPRFEAFHTVDVLQLIASGMCFGVGLTMLLARLRARGPGRPQ